MKPQEIEVINTGKRIVRTNIVPHYLPIDESKITQIEVPNFDGDGTHIETVYPNQEIDYWTYDERVEYKTCYALLTFGQYFDLNYKISMLQGYDLSLPTERYAPMNPVACKYNEQPDGSYEARLVMPIVAEVQKKYSHLLGGVELVDTFTPVESSIQEIVVDITSQDTLN